MGHLNSMFYYILICILLFSPPSECSLPMCSIQDRIMINRGPEATARNGLPLPLWYFRHQLNLQMKLCTPHSIYHEIIRQICINNTLICRPTDLCSNKDFFFKSMLEGPLFGNSVAKGSKGHSYLLWPDSCPPPSQHCQKFQGIIRYLVTFKRILIFIKSKSNHIQIW